MTEPTPEIDSFIIRFVHSNPEESSTYLRGSIRHIQSNEEITFTHWQEVEVFIKNFIPLDLTSVSQIPKKTSSIT